MKVSKKIGKVIDNKVDRKTINLAIKNFLKRGGQIIVLPPQKFSAKIILGREKWGAYENLGDMAI